MEFADEYTRLRYEESLSAREAAEESGATPERLADIDAFAPPVSSDRPSDILDHALLTDIGMLDEAALERAGIQYENDDRSEEHTSELQSLIRISYAVFC